MKEEREVVRVLVLEASPQEIQRLEHHINQAAMHCVVQTVFGVEDLMAAVDEFRPDLLLMAYGLPNIDALTLLREVRTDHPGLPVVIVSEALTDLEAVALIDAGAKGYVRKDRLDLLVPTMSNALSKERGIRERKSVERELREAIEQLRLFRALVDQSADSVEVIDPVTLRILDANETAWRILGYSREELLSLSVSDFDPLLTSEMNEAISKMLHENGIARFESLHQRKDGTNFPVEISLKQIDIDKPYRLSITRDISTRKQTEAELSRLNRVLRMLSEGNRKVLQAKNSARLMRDMCHVITTCGGYSLAWIGLTREDDNKNITPVAVSGGGTGYVQGLQLRWDDSPAGQGPAGKAIRTGHVQIVEDIKTHPDVNLWRESAGRYGYASCLALPLKMDDQTFGALSIYSKDTDAFSKSEVELLKELTTDLATGLINLRIRHERDQAHRERQRYTDRLRASMQDTIQAVATVVEMRDAYTAGHQRRVADLAVAIAHEMGLSEDQVHGIHLAGIVHDIGKIQIPAEILSKPARLSHLEYSFVKTHSQAGYDILKGISFPWPIAQAVFQHHERMDGSGYPLGVSGDEILLEARILCVADVVESMFSHRPYRPGLGIEAALDEIRKNRGILYDSEVVDAALRVFLNNKYQLPEP